MAKIIGNTTATPMAIPDWSQNDPTKADYIKNKPEKLPNPNKLILTGAVTGEYDGSNEATFNIPITNGKNGYSIFTTDTTIVADTENKAITYAAYLRWHDSRGFQVNDLVLDNTNNNVWSIIGHSSNSIQGIQLELEFVTCLQGKDGAIGKSAYSYAQDGGYTGTEAEFAAKLAEETEIDNIELITVSDIDAICGTIIQDTSTSEVTF